MKTYACSLIIGLLSVVAAWSQPAMTSANIYADIDENGGRDFIYSIGARGPLDDFPETWLVGSGLDVFGFTRFLRVSPDRVFFAHGEPVDSSREIYQDNSSSSVFFGFAMIGYQAESYSPGDPGSWEYLPRAGSNPLFESRAEVLLGARLIVNDVVHYGWLRMSRPVVDNHTLFEVAGYDWNPLPNEPIGAGLPPVIPLTPRVTAEGLLQLNWPAAVAGWILEASDELGPTATWRPVEGVSGNEALLAPPGESRFFRLRRP